MIASFLRAVRHLFSARALGAVIVSFILSGAVFTGLWFGLDALINGLPTLGWEWINSAISWLSPIVIVIAFVFLGPAVAALFVPVFLEWIADGIEARDYPTDPKAKGAPVVASLLAGLKLAGWMVLLNLLILPLHFILPVIGTALAALVNGWLLGREFFELVALRHVSAAEASALRRGARGRIWMGGSLLALSAYVPLINFFTPILATAMMTHEHKAIAALRR